MNYTMIILVLLLVMVASGCSMIPVQMPQEIQTSQSPENNTEELEVPCIEIYSNGSTAASSDCVEEVDA